MFVLSDGKCAAVVNNDVNYISVGTLLQKKPGNKKSGSNQIWWGYALGEPEEGGCHLKVVVKDQHGWNVEKLSSKIAEGRREEDQPSSHMRARANGVMSQRTEIIYDGYEITRKVEESSEPEMINARMQLLQE
jgi:hypothetical protein